MNFVLLFLKEEIFEKWNECFRELFHGDRIEKKNNIHKNMKRSVKSAPAKLSRSRLVSIYGIVTYAVSLRRFGISGKILLDNKRNIRHVE